MLATKLKRAKAGLKETKKSFDEVSTSITKETRNKWEKEEEIALKKGGKALSIYGVQLAKGQLFCRVSHRLQYLIVICSTFPS
jgi:hypothetical protein